MKKSVAALLFALLLSGVAGCSTRGTLTLVNGAVPLSHGATFEDISVEDASGHMWEEGEEKIDLEQALREAIDIQLQKENMLGGDYSLKTTIVHYEPGNAFKRWLMPGYGSTELITRTEVFNRDGELVAVVPTAGEVGFGGVFTIGAWKRVLDDVAVEIVNVLKKATGRG